MINRKPLKNDNNQNKHYINDIKSSNLGRSNNFNESININSNNNYKEPKSSALRSLLNEIKSENSSRSSSKTPPNLNFNQKSQNILVESQRININKYKESTKEVNFTDMKSDIQNLQEKIKGLEKKLCK